ncbi:MAG TPA: site-2 protease family protein [Elusimicrobiota bacterium]|nr:site-2 protease family protein [Elusimicrobiota bacterium]
MTSTKRGLAFALSLFVFASAPGLPAYAAAAEVFDAAPAQVAPPAWIPVLGAASTEMDALQDPAAQNVSGILDQIQLEAVLHPGSADALAFIGKLPAAADTPEKISALPREERLQVLSQAVAAAGRKLSAQAAPLVADLSRPGFKPSAAQRRVLSHLASAWFYLPPAQAAAVRDLARRETERSAVQKAKNLARSLAGKIYPVPVLDPEVAAGARMMFARLRPALAQAASGPCETAVKDILAPQAAQALAQASRSLAERGHPRGALWTAVLKNHRQIFGAMAEERMVKALKNNGRWTELVSALSLAAAGELAREDDAEAAAVLRKAGADYDLRLPIPSWHPLAGQFESVADALSSFYGPPEEEPLGPGLRLGRPFGIPVVIRSGTALALALIGVQMFQETSMVMPGAAKSSLAFLAGISAVLIYGSVLAHEFGHALMARARGIGTHKITLNIMGGAAFIDHEARKPLTDFLVAAAGPAVNVLLAAACFAPAFFHIGVPHLLAQALVPFVLTNLLLAGFNILPVLPMDGGLMLRAVLSAIMRDDYRAARAAEKTAKIVAIASLAAAAALLISGHAAAAMAVVFLSAVGFMPHVISHPGTTLVSSKTKTS